MTLKSANNTLRHLLKQKCDEMSDNSPDRLVQRLVSRGEAHEKEMARIEEELDTARIAVEDARSRLEQEVSDKTALKEQFNAWIAAQKHYANLQAQQDQRLRDIAKPYLQFQLAADAKLSPGRRAILHDIIRFMGASKVQQMTSTELIRDFSGIADEIAATGVHRRTQIVGGCLTGLRSVGIVDENSNLTMFGVSVMNIIAGEIVDDPPLE